MIKFNITNLTRRWKKNMLLSVLLQLLKAHIANSQRKRSLFLNQKKSINSCIQFLLMEAFVMILKRNLTEKEKEIEIISDLQVDKYSSNRK